MTIRALGIHEQILPEKWREGYYSRSLAAHSDNHYLARSKRVQKN